MPVTSGESGPGRDSTSDSRLLECPCDCASIRHSCPRKFDLPQLLHQISRHALEPRGGGQNDRCSVRCGSEGGPVAAGLCAEIEGTGNGKGGPLPGIRGKSHGILGLSRNLSYSNRSLPEKAKGKKCFKGRDKDKAVGLGKLKSAKAKGTIQMLLQTIGPAPMTTPLRGHLNVAA